MSQVPSAPGGMTTGVSPAPAHVLCRTGTGRPLRFRLLEARVVVGAEPGVAIPLALAGVSRQHLAFEFAADAWWVEDLGSSNGTFLNGRLVSRDRLRHLDVVGVGRSVELLFLQRAQAPASLRSRGIVHAALVAERGPDPVQPVPLGELTLGRASACNVVVAGSAVSKIHARVERTSQLVTIRDLGSANGTFVNGERVTVVPLRDGDLVSLGGVATFRVVVEEGDIPTLPGLRVPAPVPAAAAEGPAFSLEWKTRYDWDEAEMKEIADLQQKLRERAAQQSKKNGAAPPRPERKAGATVDAKAPLPEAPPTLLPAVRPPAVSRVLLVAADEPALVAAEPWGEDIVRANDAALRPQHPTVSRRHARLTISSDRRTVTVEDLGGRTGTRVNDTPVQGSVVIVSGDRLSLGECVFTVTIETS